jgi:hypothetical protein
MQAGHICSINSYNDYESFESTKQGVMLIMEIKTCIKCGRDFEIDKYYKDVSQKDRHTIYCKECIRKYQFEHKDMYKKYREITKITRVKYMIIYRIENKDKIKELKAKWDKDNAEHNIKYREDNKDKKAISNKKYSLENKKKIAENSRRYRKNKIKKYNLL